MAKKNKADKKDSKKKKKKKKGKKLQVIRATWATVDIYGAFSHMAFNYLSAISGGPIVTDIQTVEDFVVGLKHETQLVLEEANFATGSKYLVNLSVFDMMTNLSTYAQLGKNNTIVIVDILNSPYSAYVRVMSDKPMDSPIELHIDTFIGWFQEGKMTYVGKH